MALDNKSTFTRNLKLPVHRWYRFPAGFSAEWAETTIENHLDCIDGRMLLDPFAGVGTTILAGASMGIPSVGIEAQPFIQRIAETKLLWHTSVADFCNRAQAIIGQAKQRISANFSYPKLILGCFSEQSLNELDNLRDSWERLDDGSPGAKLTWLALVGILRPCSSAGTAPWQYVLPSKTKRKVLAPYEAFQAQVQKMSADMASLQFMGVRHNAHVYLDDARLLAKIPDDSVGLVVTSPPYANNYDYGDATRFEMTFLGEISGWGDLQDKVRKNLIRSCSQHASVEKLDLHSLLNELLGTTCLDEISSVCETLRTERLNHGGKKDYHLMVAAYFADMRKVWRSLRRVCSDNSEVCFVVGDSAPYGVHVPIERWLGQLAMDAGFQSYEFEKIRDRNVKWKNRKHRVPLQEGFLWVSG